MKPTEWRWEQQVNGRRESFIQRRCLWSDRGLDIRLSHPLLRCLSPAPALLSCLPFFCSHKPSFYLALFSLCQSAEAAVRYCFALSPPNPTSALPHNCHNNSIHSSLFIQYCQGRLILTVGVKTYIIDIKHPHPRRSKRWWQTTTIAYRQNELFVWVWPQYSAHRSSGLLGFGTVAAINIWIFRKQLMW